MQSEEREELPRGATLDGGNYRIERLLGAGGFALTYQATQGRWNLAVCLKEFFPSGCRRGPAGIEPVSPQDLQAFQDEAGSLARFNHPGIVRVLGSFQENNTAYLVQELLEGLTLSDGLSMAGKMRQSSVLQVAQQVGHALLMVHAAGLVHSDIKPENLFLTREGRYVLLDFGLTRGFLSAASAQRGGRGLSSGYAPPEQYIPGTPLGPETDVYGFAATLYTLLTGLAPPDAHLRHQGQPLPELGPLNGSVTARVERALRNALELDPRRRTPGIREFLHQLELDSTPKAVVYRPSPFRARLGKRAHPTGLTAMALDSRGGRLYSGGRDGYVRAWSWPELDPLAELPIFESPLSELTLSFDGNFLAAGSQTGEIRLLSRRLDHPGLTLEQTGSTITSLQFSGDRIAAGCMDGRCCLVGPALPEAVCWVAHAGPCYSVAFPPDGSFLASAGEDGVVRFWEVPEPQMFAELKGHQKAVQSAVFNADGTALLSASNDGHAKLWDLTCHQVVRDFKAQGAMVLQARFASQPGLVLSLSGDHTLRAFSWSSSRTVFLSDVKNERTRCLVEDAHLPLVATAAGDGSICLWDYGQSQELELPESPRPEELGPVAVPALEDPLLGSKVGEYRVVERLGAGGMATVYRAEDAQGHSVAIKVIRPDHVSAEFLERFEREIQLSLKLNHPNVLRTLSWGRQGKLTYLVMEYVDGLPLTRHIPAEGLPLSLARRFLQGVLEAVEHAHGLGIVHRDLKPENVMVTRSGVVKLMDFGLARDREVKTVTKIGSALGTAAYMAPEQILRGPQRSGLTEKTDQYALGILIFELLTGRRPFEWNEPRKLITAHLSATPPALTSLRPDLPAALEAVVQRMLAKEPDDRFESVRTAGEALFAAF